MSRDGRRKKIRLVYILAASHSGSTLLAMLLGRHPDICTVGELKLTSLGNVGRYRCSCRKLIRDCPFWGGVNMDMIRRGFPFTIDEPGTHFGAVNSGYIRRLLKPLHRGLVIECFRDAALNISSKWRSHLEWVQARNVALMECILERTGKRILIDSSKIGLRLKYLLKNPDLDIQIIRLIRDGRGVALTYAEPTEFADANDPLLRSGGMGDNIAVRRIPISEGAREWRRSNEEAENILYGLDKKRWISIKYETMCAQPEKTMKELYSFIGVNIDRVIPVFRSVEYHVVGNGMRFDTSSKIVLDERWKSVLDSDDIEKFESVAGVMRKKLGYP